MIIMLASCTRLLLSGSECAMDESERGLLDSEVQNFLQTCADQVRRVKRLCDSFHNEGMSKCSDLVLEASVKRSFSSVHML